MKAKARDSCRPMFSKLGILTLYSQYIFSILMFAVKHKDIFTYNIELHKINTRHKLDLHVPSVNLTKVQKGVYYSTPYLLVSRKWHIILINLSMN